MKLFLSKRKPGIRAFCIMGLTLACVFAVIYLLFFNTTHFNFTAPDEPADNSLRNTATGNDFVTVANGRIVLSYAGSMLRSGVYEIAPPFARCIRKAERTSAAPAPEGVSYVYKNKPLERFLTVTDDKKVIVKALHDAEPLICLDNAAYEAQDFFTFENELYFTAKDETVIYRYGDGKMEPVVSADLCGEDFVPLQLYKGDFYYADKNSATAGTFAPLTICQYSLRDKKLVRRLDLSGMKEMYRQYEGFLCAYLICDDCAYFVFTGDENAVCRYDFDKKTAVRLLTTGADISCFNAYGNTAYITTKSADKDKEYLYALPYDADEPVQLKKGSYRRIAVIDRKWVYLEEENGHIYRITTDGKAYEKVF